MRLSVKESEMADIEITLLRDTENGGIAAQPQEIATLLADFVAAATTSLDVAIYDFRLEDAALVQPVVEAFKQAAAKGVAVRIAYDAGKPAAQTTAAFAAFGADPAPVGTQDWLTREFAGTAIELKAIEVPGKQLMHSKYIVRDVNSAAAAVWMGSANFTDAAWTRQENNIVRFNSPKLASAYETDFEEMWRSGNIASTGVNDTGDTPIEGVDVSWAFSPGEGPAIDAHLASRISEAKQRVRIASMVLTSHAVLGELAEAIEKGVDIAGVYDGGQMEGIEEEWQKFLPKTEAILKTWEKVKAALTPKPTPKYSPDGPHNFMHNKVLVSDDAVVTGSYNFSRNAEANAENQVALPSSALADEYAAYIDQLVAQYHQA
jgi:phosphatidylserine/phosphatidylglycerophosphate/cardiolipin synthase-like enzyme